ncbi:MAG: DIP1984 family protein [Clostridia bacterium]|nr:DIP1984 family protein [Clostridia bacterium]
MKLAEALSERSDIRNRISQLESRLQMNARVQEGEKPSEDPEKLLAELNGLTDRLEYLITHINLTNAETISDGETLTALLARRDCLTLRVSAMRSFLNEASSLTSRGMRSEIKILSTVNVQEYRARTDLLSKELRELDVRIQGLNWTTELI